VVYMFSVIDADTRYLAGRSGDKRRSHVYGGSNVNMMTVSSKVVRPIVCDELGFAV